MNKSKVEGLACRAFHTNGNIQPLLREASKPASRRARVGVDHARYHPTREQQRAGHGKGRTAEVQSITGVHCTHCCDSPASTIGQLSWIQVTPTRQCSRNDGPVSKVDLSTCTSSAAGVDTRVLSKVDSSAPELYGIQHIEICRNMRPERVYNNTERRREVGGGGKGGRDRRTDGRTDGRRGGGGCALTWRPRC